VSRAITGPGLDAEPDAGDVAARCGARCRHASSHRWEASRLPHSSPLRVASIGETGLLCLAAMGYTRRAETRDQGVPIELCADAARLYARQHAARAGPQPHRSGALHTHSLATAEEAVTRLGRTSEIDNERRKQTQLQQQGASTRTSTPTTRLASCQMSPPLQEGAAFGS